MSSKCPLELIEQFVHDADHPPTFAAFAQVSSHFLPLTRRLLYKNITFAIPNGYCTSTQLLCRTLVGSPEIRFLVDTLTISLGSVEPRLPIDALPELFLPSLRVILVVCNGFAGPTWFTQSPAASLMFQGLVALPSVRDLTLINMGFVSAHILRAASHHVTSLAIHNAVVLGDENVTLDSAGKSLRSLTVSNVEFFHPISSVFFPQNPPLCFDNLQELTFGISGSMLAVPRCQTFLREVGSLLTSLTIRVVGHLLANELILDLTEFVVLKHLVFDFGGWKGMECLGRILRSVPRPSRLTHVKVSSINSYILVKESWVGVDDDLRREPLFRLLEVEVGLPENTTAEQRLYSRDFIESSLPRLVSSGRLRLFNNSPDIEREEIRFQ